MILRLKKTTKNYGFYSILKWEGSLLIPSFTFPPLLSLPTPLPSLPPLKSSYGVCGSAVCELPIGVWGEAPNDLEF